MATRFTRADSQPVGIAELWDVWTEPGKPPLLSFTMLTMNATDHGLLKNYHRPEDKKRLIVILPASNYADLLSAPVADNMDFSFGITLPSSWWPRRWRQSRLRQTNRKS